MNVLWQLTIKQMKKCCLNDKAQGILEYAMLFFLVGLAIAGVTYYFSQSLQGRYKQGADVFGEGQQYERGVTVNVEE